MTAKLEEPKAGHPGLSSIVHIALLSELMCIIDDMCLFVLVYTCSMCGANRRIGGKMLLKCAGCDKTRYCGSVCQVCT
jgi:hypothetical protein